MKRIDGIDKGTGSARMVLMLAALAALSLSPVAARAEETPAARKTVRIATVQSKPRMVDFRLAEPDAVLAEVDRNIADLEKIVHRAGEAKIDALAFPEDTLGLLNWFGVNEAAARRVLPEAVARMIERLGKAAAGHRMYLVLCSDCAEDDGGVYNTAFLLGRDGKEIGRYHKVCPTFHESSRRRGSSFPVFQTPDLGTVGLLICYDLVMPETARCIALQGADIIFFPTMGGAAIGDDDIGQQALRVRAAENFIYLAVAHRGSGAMIISPQGKIISSAQGTDGMAIADIDPRGGREGGDSMNSQKDMRARLFRERNPEAFGLLADPHPPVLDKVPIGITPQEAARISARALTYGEEEFRQAETLARAGKTGEAMEAYEKLCAGYRDSWIDRVARQRLVSLRGAAPEKAAAPGAPKGIAAAYPGDAGIEKDPRVLFAETFEEGAIEDLEKRWSAVKGKSGRVLEFAADAPAGSAGKRSLQITATPGENDGGHLYKQLARGVEKMHARFYVKFAEKADYIHHFVHLGGYQPGTPWPQGGAGDRPRGDERVTAGIEPHGRSGKAPPPGAWTFYTYWQDMKISADGKYWGNGIAPQEPLLAPRGKWQCVEVMMKLNSSPEKADGELALWLDGEPAMRVAEGTRRLDWSGMGFMIPREGGEPFEGFRFRKSKDLQLNFFWLLHYVTEHARRANRLDGGGGPNRVWFDDIVVATDYIGPLQKAAGSGK